MGIESHERADPTLQPVVALQKESPSMGIESYVRGRLGGGRTLPCKKSPQAWGLKVSLSKVSDVTDLASCKKSPQAWGLKVSLCGVAFVFLKITCKKSPQAWGLKGIHHPRRDTPAFHLAKRVPKHGD